MFSYDSDHHDGTYNPALGMPSKNVRFTLLSELSSLSMSCHIPSNPDISGVGVRVAIYLQNFLCFIPAIWAIWDGNVSDYELESAEIQSTTNLVLAFAILISCIVQALTLGLTNYHAAIVLSLSWMNNTNAFIYFLLYVQYKSQKGAGHVQPRWSSWFKHIKNQARAVIYLPNSLTDNPAANQRDVEAGKGGAKILFRRIALLLGSLHLTLMAAMGIWLWRSPRSFGISDSACAIQSAQLTVLGARVPFGSNSLRVISLAIYSLFLLPGFNLLLPMAAFLSLYFWHHSRNRDVHPPVGGIRSGTLGTAQAIYTTCMQSPIFPVCLGLGLLFSINVVFVADIEATLRRNIGLQGDRDEDEWGFGQILAMLLLFMPLRDIVEAILARRLRRQELEIGKRDWKEALHLGNVHHILALVKRGADPNVKTEDGWTALEAAVVKNDWDAVHILLKSSYPTGADIDATFHDGRTALEAATVAQNLEAVRLLIDANVNLNIIFHDGRTALEVAALNENLQMVEDLISAKADVNLENRDGRTVLEVATLSLKWEVVRLLVNAGADVNVVFKGEKHTGDEPLERPLLSEMTPIERFRKIFPAAIDESFHSMPFNWLEDPVEERADRILAKEGQRALEVAILVRNMEAAQLLLDAGADASIVFRDGRTAIEAAARAGRWDTIRSLVIANADVNAPFLGGYTILHRACNEGQFELADLLLDKGADPNTLTHFPLESSLSFGVPIFHISAFHSVCYWGVTVLAQRFLSLGADPNLRDGCFETVLTTACRGAHVETVQLLLDWGADLDCKARCKAGPEQPDCPQCEKFMTPLQAACLGGSLDVVQLLLEKGADLHVATVEYGSTLHAACNSPAKGSIEVVAFLLEKGVDPNAQGDKHGSALHAACAERKGDVVKMLLEHNADPGIMDKNGATPLHVAAKVTSPTCVQYLLDSGADVCAKDNDDHIPLDVIPKKRVKKGSRSAVETLDLLRASMAGADRRRQMGSDENGMHTTD